MSLPICEVCAKTGILCNVCEEKLAQEKISVLDVELSKILFELGEGDISFSKAIETQDAIVVVAPKESIGKIIGRSGANIRVISKKLGKPVRVVGSGELKDMIYDFASPARVIGVNKVFRPDGSTIQRVRIPRKDKPKLRLGVEDMEKIISSLSEDQVEILFE